MIGHGNPCRGLRSAGLTHCCINYRISRRGCQPVALPGPKMAATLHCPRAVFMVSRVTE